ncbi:DUF1073 domain-containing protein [Thiolapillus sp.]|uniref:phage portal protein n=1 Tax=Thiolapillus sp. TaxID=2017437 RepID=UPI003AF6B8CB
MTDKKYNHDSYNRDGFVNPATGLGVQGIDPAASGYNLRSFPLDEHLLRQMYRYDWLAAKIVELPAKDAVQKWIEVSDDLEFIDVLDDYEVKASLRKCLTWARLFGGAVLWPVVDDGMDPALPYNPDRVRGLHRIDVLDRWRIIPEIFDQDVPPEYYQYKNIRIHTSRLFVMRGTELTHNDMLAELWYGGSVLDSVFESLTQYSDVYGSIRKYVSEISVGVLKVPDLTLVPEGSSVWDRMAKRLQNFNLNKSVFKAVAIDAEEEFNFVNRSGQGLAEISDRYRYQICGACGIPEFLLFGKSASGLQSTNEVDMDVYHDLVTDLQSSTLTKPLNRLIEIVAKVEGLEVPEWDWAELRPSDALKDADVREKNARALASESQSMGLTEDEARDVAKIADDRGLFEELGAAPDIPDLEPDFEMDPNYGSGDE